MLIIDFPNVIFINDIPPAHISDLTMGTGYDSQVINRKALLLTLTITPVVLVRRCCPTGSTVKFIESSTVA